jgi:hypothetical protein
MVQLLTTLSKFQSPVGVAQTFDPLHAFAPETGHGDSVLGAGRRDGAVASGFMRNANFAGVMPRWRVSFGRGCDRECAGPTLSRE